jgi:hypothetical protein
MPQQGYPVQQGGRPQTIVVVQQQPGRGQGPYGPQQNDDMAEGVCMGCLAAMLCCCAMDAMM